MSGMTEETARAILTAVEHDEEATPFQLAVAMLLSTQAADIEILHHEVEILRRRVDAVAPWHEHVTRVNAEAAGRAQ